jgi:DNA-binding response OmpR family regulator
MAKTKVLVVDDEEDFAKALRVRLIANGYDVVLAHDSIQAIMTANLEKPDLILLDIMIPGDGAIETISGDATYSDPFPHRGSRGGEKGV